MRHLLDESACAYGSRSDATVCPAFEWVDRLATYCDESSAPQSYRVRCDAHEGGNDA